MALSIYPEESIGHTIRQSWSLSGIFLVLAVSFWSECVVLGFVRDFNEKMLKRKHHLKL